MRTLPTPVIDDPALLAQVIASTRITAAPIIQPFHAQILARYALYLQTQANPWAIDTDPQFLAVRPELQKLYSSPPQSLKFIKSLREDTGGACPVCGGFGTGTLDHYLPKADFPEFSFLSCNLIPACYRCNLGKRSKVRGDAADQRPVHAYFDSLPCDLRTMTVETLPPFEAPAFRAIAINVPPGLEDAVEWHLENVVKPAGLASVCQHRWKKLVSAPKKVLGTVSTAVEVIASLHDQAARAAYLNESLNNWDSCFYDGVARNHAAVDYIVARL